jgi:hypothetical protein
MIDFLQFNNSTIQQFTSSTIQQFNNSTVQQLYNYTTQQFKIPRYLILKTVTIDKKEGGQRPPFQIN